MNIQRTILVKFLQKKDSEAIMNLDTKKFTGEHFRILNFLKDFIADNSGQLPTQKILRRHFPSFSEDLKRRVKEPTKYLLDELDNAYAHNSLVDLITDVTKQLKNKDSTPPKSVLQFLEKQMLTLRSEVSDERQKGKDITKRRDSIKERLQERSKKGGILGFHLPFPSLTKQLRGLRKKRLYTLIARTSVGKTVMTFIIALYVWRQYNCPVVFLSGELDYEQMEDMYLSFISGIPIHKIENGDLTKKEMDELERTLRDIEKTKAPFIFGFSSSYADVITEVNTHSPEILFVDSFYELDRFNEPDDTKRTAMVVSRLQRMSREYDIPVFINTQANRATDKKRGADLSNISFSDTIGQTSDVVLTLNQSDDMRMSKEMEISLLKNRGGRLAKILLNWNFDDNDFTEIRELDESGDVQDTSELTNKDVEDGAKDFSRLLGRDRKKKKAQETGKSKKRIVKKSKKATEDDVPWEVDKPSEGKKVRRVLPKNRGAQKSVA